MGDWNSSDAARFDQLLRLLIVNLEEEAVGRVLSGTLRKERLALFTALAVLAGEFEADKLLLLATVRYYGRQILERPEPADLAGRRQHRLRRRSSRRQEAEPPFQSSPVARVGAVSRAVLWPVPL